MKTQKFLTVFAITALLFSLSINELYAQRGMRAERPTERPQRTQMMEHCASIPDLTEAQTEAIKGLRTEKLKAATEHRNKMAELRARKRTLMTSDSPDMTEVDKIIDEMSELRKAHLKGNARHMQSVRSLLTEDQRVYFDARRPHSKRGSDGNRGSGRGMRR